jgi:hypothetical protein
MFKKTILSIMIGTTIQVQAESADKYVLTAGTPSIKQASQSTANQLVLAVGSFDPLNETLDFSQSKIISKNNSKYSIVQFEAGKADSQWLQNQGIEVLSYLPNNAFIIKSDKNTKTSLVKNSSVRWQGPYLPQYKISPELWTKNLKREVTYDIMVSIFKDFPKKNIELLFRKYLPEAKIKQIFQGKHNELILTIHNKNIDAALSKLASIEEIQFVQTVKPLKILNSEAVSAVQDNEDPQGLLSNDTYVPNNTPIWNKGLIGSGQIVGVADTGLDSNEDWFVHYDNGLIETEVITEAEDTTPPTIGTTYPDRKVFGYFVMPGAQAYDHSGAGFHGTHVTGSIAGDRKAAITETSSGSVATPTDPGYDNDDGMAPNAQILFQDIGGIISSGEMEGEAALTGQGSSPMWEQAYNAGVRIHSNSYGSTGDGAYSFSDLFLDRTLHEFEDMLILFAAGNDGSGENTIGSPGNAKNALTVGASAHGNSPFETNFSSRGPTDDGRIKPDIMAPGAKIRSAAGNEDNSNVISIPPGRSIKDGTSMATPIAAGSSALLRQYYTDGFYPTGIANPDDAHNPTGPLMKATLINGAGVDGGHFDKDIGWGRLFLNNSIMFDDSDKQLRVWEVSNPNGIKTGEEITFKLGVKAGQDFATTLVWYDVPGPFGSTKTLINDLDLTVKVGGSTYKGNVFSDIAMSATGGTRDSINTVEQVRLPSPVEGIYTITVKATDVPGDGSLNAIRQGFALVATGSFDNIDSTPAAMSAVTNLSAVSLGDNGIQLDWAGGANADYFEIYKVEGTCATADFANARFTGNSESNTFTDFRTLKGKQYAYKIRAGQYKELGSLASSCVDITSVQACDFLPSFDQSSIAITNNVGDLCHTKIQWSAGTNNCDTSTPISKYNIYRSSDPNFVPGPNNLLTTVSDTSYDDIRAPSEAAYYTIRAEDDSTNGTGPNGGTETTGSAKIRSQAIGTGFTSGPVFEDVDNIAIMNLSFPWEVASGKAADGIFSYKSGSTGGNYPADQCSSMVTNTIELTGDLVNPSIDYKALYNLEENWDGVVVEISTDDGTTWNDFPPDSGYPSDFSETTSDPVNACGYASTHGAFSGSNNDTFESFSHDLTPFIGQNIKLRWRLSSDPASEFEGFYLDSISYPNIQQPTACTVNTAPLKPEAGLYYDRGRNGHGFVIEPIENTDLYFTVFYTYKNDGTPEWYTSLSSLENNVLNMDLSSDPNNGALNRFIYDFNVDPTGNGNPNTIDSSVGQSSLKVDFNSESIASSSACTDGQSRGANIALATWQLGNQQGEWCIEPLSNIIGNAPTSDFGGTWWTGMDDDGWGLSLSFTEGNNTTIVVTIYYFDATGHPRWVQGTQSNFVLNQEMMIDMLEFTGYGREATPTGLNNTSTGSLGITINSNGVDGNINLDINYQGNETGNWNRLNTPITIFTAPHQ